MTAVQSVYIALRIQIGAIIPGELPLGESLVLLDRPLMGAGLGLLRMGVMLGGLPWLAFVSWGLVVACATPGQAGVVFDNCQTLPGGAVSCNTRPTGNTRDNDEAARYGLFDEASPGWNEFDPDEGYNSMMGLNQY